MHGTVGVRISSAKCSAWLTASWTLRVCCCCRSCLLTNGVCVCVTELGLFGKHNKNSQTIAQSYGSNTKQLHTTAVRALIICFYYSMFWFHWNDGYLRPGPAQVTRGAVWHVTWLCLKIIMCPNVSVCNCSGFSPKWWPVFSCVCNCPSFCPLPPLERKRDKSLKRSTSDQFSQWDLFDLFCL